ncbi:hypothetical protein MYX07_04385 [Patescibacteria group bacterium AH-259-L07]|nr:hypothetical protein [Patescibacteria group bacterium AH-259-L07]
MDNQQIFFLSPSQKKERAEKKLSTAKPLVIARCKDGIVLVGENPSVFQKTAELYDKIAFGAIGKITDFNKYLKEPFIHEAANKGKLYDREDVHMESLVQLAAATFDMFHSNFSVWSLSTEIALAEITDKPETDKISTISYTASIENLKREPYVILGRKIDPLKKSIEKLLKDKKFQQLTMKKAIALIKTAIEKTSKQDSSDDKIVFEVSVLVRKNDQERKFQRLEGEGV